MTDKTDHMTPPLAKALRYQATSLSRHEGTATPTDVTTSKRIKSIIVDQESVCTTLRKCLGTRFPNIIISGETPDYLEASQLIRDQSPELVFVDAGVYRGNPFSSLSDRAHPFDVVLISKQSEDAIHAIRQDICGFILKPLNVSDVMVSVESVIRKLRERMTLRGGDSSHEHPQLPHTKLIGVPTMEGMEFLNAHEIIRCEGLQKCTRIVTTRTASMVSSYNIGEFRKILEAHGFFPCHKSHLINLMHVKRLTREGFVFLTDGAAIPLARRKRPEFLQLLTHL